MAAIDFPSNPTTGQTLTVGQRTWQWNGTVWESDNDRAFTRTVSDTAPSAPVVGDEWFNSATGRLYTYFDSYWIEIGASVSGLSAYQVAVANGFVGTESDWLDSLSPSAAIAALVDSAPATLDTLNELAAALGDDANFATTVTTSLATKTSTGKAIAMAIVFG